ncbi:MAG: Crp/Fnr family transcriptional regulator, partial [Dysgonomonas sp.]
VSALINEPSNFALEAIEQSTIISFDYKKFRQLIDEHIDLKNFYIAYLEKNWVIDKEKRELEIVLKEAKERYLEFINSHPNIETRIPLHYIASHLGITPTQLSRIRKNIQEKSS